MTPDDPQGERVRPMSARPPQRAAMTENIGIIAGGGQFPALIAQGAREAGFGVVICGFHGNTGEDLAGRADAFQLLHLGQMNKLLDFFHQHNVRKLCMAGSINKPRALDIRPDWRAAKLIFSLRNKGDDSLLRTALRELERQGFEVLSAADIVPALRSPEGILTRNQPTPAIWDDIKFGWPIAKAMGQFDIGQCLVVREGMVMAVECLEGTDATLQRGSELGGAGCVAVKLVKPGQDERVDLPSVGLATVQNLAKGNYAALAIQAEKTLFFDRAQSIALAEKNKIAIVALPENFS